MLLSFPYPPTAFKDASNLVFSSSVSGAPFEGGILPAVTSAAIFLIHSAFSVASAFVAIVVKSSPPFGAAPEWQPIHFAAIIGLASVSKEAVATGVDSEVAGSEFAGSELVGSVIAAEFEVAESVEVPPEHPATAKTIPNASKREVVRSIPKYRRFEG